METRLQRRRALGQHGEAARDCGQGRRWMRQSSAASSAGGGGASATVSCVGGSGLLFEACHEALAQLEVLRIILEYVEEGRFCFVGGVSTQWRASYTALYPGAETSFSSVVSSEECLNWATSQQGLELSVKLFKAGALYGDVEVCKALHGKDCPWVEAVYHETAFNRKHGLGVLKWLRSEDVPSKEPYPWSRNGTDMLSLAAKEGHLEMLKWLILEGHASFYEQCWNDACWGGHIPVVEWLLDHPPTRAVLEDNDYEEWRHGAWFAAAKGRLELLQFLHANARHLCDWDAVVCIYAVMYGKNLAVLKWLRSEEVQCEWDQGSCPQVIRDTGYECFCGEDEEWDIDAKPFEEIKQWVHANGHPCDCQD